MNKFQLTVGLLFCMTCISYVVSIIVDFLLTLFGSKITVLLILAISSIYIYKVVLSKANTDGGKDDCNS